MNRIPSTKNIQVFIRAAQNLSFTTTAAELNMTQPAVSQCIKQLEQQIGVPLFIRKNRVLLLSDAGKTFAHDAEIALNHLEQSINNLKAKAASDERVTLSISTAFATHWLLPRVSQFKLDHPDIDLRFQTTSYDIDLAQAGIGLGVRQGTGNFPGYHAQPLYDEMVVPVCAPGFLKGGPLHRAEDLLDHPLIHLDEPHRTRVNWQQWFQSQNVDMQSKGDGLLLNDYAIVLQAAMEGQGIALGWVYIVKPLLQSGQLEVACPIHLKTGKQFFLVRPLSLPFTERTRRVSQWLIQQAEQSNKADT